MKNKIKELRKYKGLTQKELSKRTGIKITTISNYELQRRKLDVDVAARLANAFDVNWWELYEEE
ncbi:helix-turn-helix transcriptional regulator [Helcococcus ovis]|uniref:helix-turn-helix domain-containing protein n=1 Tax=Helcococcus TaxID=31983 RepID=UPI0038BB1655